MKLEAVKKQSPGRSFEESVYEFSKTLDPSAEVLFEVNPV
jgi:hypothetical protein